MILNNTPKNEAILSNVGEIGEFRIRNSAKAFSILSSGLYANKIRAIIRELSCNAVDSHVAAGKEQVPFDIHLPNTLEPWFAIRDYGLGLSHDQVTNIYTTYFESTKTDSNAFIGALGLGSKSPFGYTDNFTVTAIKDGRKGIYTAFINETGVPSIALMAEEQTTEPNGVEIMMAVAEQNDFYNFRSEAAHVYTHFKLRPVVAGCSNFKFNEPVFKEKDIVPGVHYLSNSYSYALMGNIAYPINVPQAKTTLGELHSLLDCGLMIEFNIGDLDFQPSREGLSYIPSTIAAIKDKLELLNGRLAEHVAEKANTIKNQWERAYYLKEASRESLWVNAVKKYVADTGFALIKVDSFVNMIEFTLIQEEMAKKFNVSIKTFEYAAYQKSTKNVPTGSIYDNDSKLHRKADRVEVDRQTHFVINDTTVGALERAKYHWRNAPNKRHEDTIHVLNATDKKKPINTKGFFKFLKSPPETQIQNASSLLKRERENGIGKNVSILKLEQRDDGWNRNSKDMVWRGAGNLSDLDDTETYYYVPLSGFMSLGKVPKMTYFCEMLKRANIFTGEIHGVRKTDIESVRSLKNWIEIDTVVLEKLQKTSGNDVLGTVKHAIEFDSNYRYTDGVIEKIDVRSPYVIFYNELKDVVSQDHSTQNALDYLYTAYDVSAGKIDVSALKAKYLAKMQEISTRYPLLSNINYAYDKSPIVEYINAIDHMKGY